MVTPRDRTPIVGLPVPDPDQLTLGGLDPAGAVQTAVRELAPTARPDDGQTPAREPPVCGEWSFDLDETPESRAGAMFVPTPTFAQVAIPAPRPVVRTSGAAATQAATATAALVGDCPNPARWRRILAESFDGWRC